MSDGSKSFIKRLLVTTLAVFVAEKMLDGIAAKNFGSLIAAAVLLGLFNAVLRPIMMLLTLPLLLFTLGLFTLVINACLLYMVGALLRPEFVVTTFGTAFLGALVISIVSLFANLMIGKDKPKVRVNATVSTNRTPLPNQPKPPQDTGTGPVIDI